MSCCKEGFDTLQCDQHVAPSEPSLLNVRSLLMHTYRSARRHSVNVRHHEATKCSFNAAISLFFFQFQILGRVIVEHVFDPRRSMSPIWGPQNFAVNGAEGVCVVRRVWDVTSGIRRNTVCVSIHWPALLLCCLVLNPLSCVMFLSLRNAVSDVTRSADIDGTAVPKHVAKYFFHCFTVHFNSLYIMVQLMNLFVIKH
jgi:hypothetical protein